MRKLRLFLWIFFNEGDIMANIKVYQCKACLTMCTIPGGEGPDDPTNCPFNGHVTANWKLIKVDFFELIAPFIKTR